MPPVSIRAGDASDYRDAQLLVITAGAQQKPGETRLDLQQRNAAIMRQIMKEIIAQDSGALGNSFVFLMAGVASDYTEIGLIWSNIGKRVALFLPLVTVPQVLLLGWLANLWL